MHFIKLIYSPYIVQKENVKEKPKSTNLVHKNWCACICDINPYLHEFFEPILIHSIFSVPWRGNLAKFESWYYLRNQRGHAHQNWCACIWHQSLLAWITVHVAYWLRINIFCLLIFETHYSNFMCHQKLSPERITWSTLATPKVVHVHACWSSFLLLELSPSLSFRR